MNVFEAVPPSHSPGQSERAFIRNGKWIVSYVWNGVAMRFATFNQEEIEKRLVPVS